MTQVSLQMESVVLEYTDGTVNLATINIDGSDKNITEHSDGTWMRTIDWSPDGKKLVFTGFVTSNKYICCQC